MQRTISRGSGAYRRWWRRRWRWRSSRVGETEADMAASFLERASRPLSCPTPIFSSLLRAFPFSLSVAVPSPLSPDGLEKGEENCSRSRARENRANYSSLRLHNSTVNLITVRSYTRALAAHGGQVPSQYNNRRRIHPPPRYISYTSV